LKKGENFMNQFLRIQIENIINTLNTFLMSCKIAAQRDDGKIDKKEEKTGLSNQKRDG
jgi:hypothetical protein